ncbi:hypothetical protein BOTBODRAFT_635548 [Botryobasidium botryosum FD-172 SS1]|uniref:DUF6532 domain-containing protein n=1 Tax=Botryobasidium botryosum (strain FD-172 SS1) TaxID=930990 RepID=A0A067MKH1_BOTB1|nr:hypothetical protein BOTBODRAFT_635548 [Botryobasidium botryosum FD-172 SS1]
MPADKTSKSGRCLKPSSWKRGQALFYSDEKEEEQRLAKKKKMDALAARVEAEQEDKDDRATRLLREKSSSVSTPINTDEEIGPRAPTHCVNNDEDPEDDEDEEQEDEEQEDEDEEEEDEDETPTRHRQVPNSDAEGDVFSSSKHQNPLALDRRAPRNTVNSHPNRPKASDYAGQVRLSLIAANHRFRCLVATQDPFPKPDDAIGLGDIAFEDVTGGLEAMDAQLKVITKGTCQMRSKLKRTIRLILPAHFSFTETKSPLYNRKLYKSLIEGDAYIHEIPEEKAGKFLHTLGFEAFKSMWFENGEDDGMHYADIFGPCLSPKCIALIYTMIRTALDEWATGIRVGVKFVTGPYRTIYKKLLKEIRDIETSGPDGKAIIQAIGEEFWTNASSLPSAKYIRNRAPETSLSEAEISGAIQYAQARAARLKAQQAENDDADAENADYN